MRGVTPEAMARLGAYQWKGNIRELENVIERAIILAQGEWIGVEDLPANLTETAANGRAAPPAESLRVAAREAEKARILHVLSQERDKRAAARLLGISLSSLYRKLEEFGLPTRTRSER